MNCILFFNGWGMDQSNFKNLAIPDNFELKIINFPYEIKFPLDTYDEIIAIGWSFGCYYLTKYLLKNSLTCKQIIAINGHSNTIGKYGIHPKILNLTLNTLTPENLLKFYNNMAVDKNFQPPKKNFDDILNELQYFKDNYTDNLPNLFTKAIVATNDKIIPTAKQQLYFKKNNVPIINLTCGHYIWHKISSWQDLWEAQPNEF